MAASTADGDRTRATLGRVVTAMATPFADDGSLDLDGAQRLAEHLVETGTETVLVCGTTGESPTLSDDEQDQLLRAVIDAVGDRVTVMMGTGTNDTAKSVKLTERATAAGAGAVLVVTPYYNKPDQRGLLEHFRTVAAATDRPVLLYDIPGRTSREIAVDTLVELHASVDNIIGVKDANEDIDKTSTLLSRAEPGFEVYSGADALNLPILAVGGVGFVSVASHLGGTQLVQMAEAFATDPGKAREIHLRLVPLFAALFLDPNPAPLKWALDQLGLPAGRVRPPLADARLETRDAMRRALDAAGVELR